MFSSIMQSSKDTIMKQDGGATTQIFWEHVGYISCKYVIPVNSFFPPVFIFRTWIERPFIDLTWWIFFINFLFEFFLILLKKQIFLEEFISKKAYSRTFLTNFQTCQIVLSVGWERIRKYLKTCYIELAYLWN